MVRDMSEQPRALRIERGEHPGIVEVVLLGPGKGNAMGPEFWDEAPGAFESLSADPDVRAVIVRGHGEHFTYGLDLVAMGPTVLPLVTGGAAERAAIVALGERMQRAFRRLAACRAPVIAAIDGWCIGAGVELVCACDVRLCTAAARFSLREVKVCMVSDLGGLQRLPFIVGEGRAREMALTGDDYPAAAAERMGLVNAVLPDADALLREARALAGRIAANPPLAVAAAKQVMNARIDASVDRGLREALLLNSTLMPSADFQEAVAAFLERRPPRFRGA
jgi:enoyl-CoA hydratase